MSSAKNKILHILPIASGGGVGNVGAELTRALSDKSKVVLLAPSNGKTPYPLYKPSTMRFEFISDISFSTLNSYKVHHIIKDFVPDVIISHSFVTLPLYLTMLPGFVTPIICVVHGTHLNEMRWSRYHPMSPAKKLEYRINLYTQLLLVRVSAIRLNIINNFYLVGVSSKTVEELGVLGFRRHKCFSILNGVDKNRFYPRDKSASSEVLNKSGYSEIDRTATTILHVNPSFRKGTHILLKSFNILIQTNPDIKLLIIGKMTKSLRSYLTQYISKHNLNYRVHYIGQVDQNLLPYFYSASDIVVAPSFSEGAPLVVSEALASKKPTIVTDVGGNSEYLLLVNLPELLIGADHYDFSRELADKMKFTIDNLNYLANKIRMDCLPSWDDVAKRYLRIIDQVKGHRY